jgi:N-methylhydantoinase A
LDHLQKDSGQIGFQEVFVGIIGIDTGGTFTDFIYHDGAVWQVFKHLSSPENPAEAVLEGLKQVAGNGSRIIVHGSTVATNAILERKGAKTAFVTNKGFVDILLIGRQHRSRLYDLSFRRHPPIVAEDMCFGVPGRVLYNGKELEALDVDAVRKVCSDLRQAGVASVAVCFLFSFANPSHEIQVAEALRSSEISVTMSHEILSEFREFERASTTVINAYVSPKMKRYISTIRDRIDEDDTIRIMQSNGGSISAETAMTESVKTILSGPAGGVVGAFEIGRLTGLDRLITFDMGGTSTDVSLVDGNLSMTLESEISGFPIKTPMIDIHTVGAGGGSIASVDAGGALTVGPESAGADPGPVCYGRGERITVTDANLFLGRLIPDQFLGGNMALSPDRLKAPFERVAASLSMDPITLAEGIVSVANANMERAIRVISVERGYDPREFTLFSFGGAGGLHAAFLARQLSMPKVLVPRHPGILSAIGMLMADVIKDYSQTVMLDQEKADPGLLKKYFEPLDQKGIQEMLREGTDPSGMTLEHYLDMRYEGQSFEIITPFSNDFIETFQRLHEKNYGYRNNRSVEIVNIRLRARGIPKKPVFETLPDAGKQPSDGVAIGERPVVFDGNPVATKVFSRPSLGCGHVIPGPAVIVEYSATTVIPPFATGRIDRFGNIVLSL